MKKYLVIIFLTCYISAVGQKQILFDFNRIDIIQHPKIDTTLITLGSLILDENNNLFINDHPQGPFRKGSHPDNITCNRWEQINNITHQDVFLIINENHALLTKIREMKITTFKFYNKKRTPKKITLF